MKRNLLIAAAAIAVVSLGTLGALAHGGASGVVKERMDLMETVGKAMKSLTDMMRGKQDYDADRVRAAARQIADHGGESLTKLFPENSLDGPTEALPVIWTEWDRFAALADQLTAYATALEAAADNRREASGGAMMMGGGQTMMNRHQTMMNGSQMMMGGNQMMMGAGPMMSAEELAEMPPDAAFMHLADACSSCHQDFRKEKR